MSILYPYHLWLGLFKKKNIKKLQKNFKTENPVLYGKSKGQTHISDFVHTFPFVESGGLNLAL